VTGSWWVELGGGTLDKPRTASSGRRGEGGGGGSVHRGTGVQVGREQGGGGHAFGKVTSPKKCGG